MYIYYIIYEYIYVYKKIYILINKFPFNLSIHKLKKIGSLKIFNDE